MVSNVMLWLMLYMSKLPKFIASTLERSAPARLSAGDEKATIISTPLTGKKVIHRIP